MTFGFLVPHLIVSFSLTDVRALLSKQVSQNKYTLLVIYSGSIFFT